MQGNAPFQEIDFGSLDDLVGELGLAPPERSADVVIDQLSEGVDGDTLLTAVGLGAVRSTNHEGRCGGLVSHGVLGLHAAHEVANRLPERMRPFRAFRRRTI